VEAPHSFIPRGGHVSHAGALEREEEGIGGRKGDALPPP
jgi:hypothetical protein